jgi:hypothetical protein
MINNILKYMYYEEPCQGILNRKVNEWVNAAPVKWFFDPGEIKLDFTPVPSAGATLEE